MSDQEAWEAWFYGSIYFCVFIGLVILIAWPDIIDQPEDVDGAEEHDEHETNSVG